MCPSDLSTKHQLSSNQSINQTQVCNRYNVLMDRSSGVSLRYSENQEMTKILHQLMHLVPGMPLNKKLSILEIIHFVIDYIVELETALLKDTSQL